MMYIDFKEGYDMKDRFKDNPEFLEKQVELALRCLKKESWDVMIAEMGHANYLNGVEISTLEKAIRAKYFKREV